MELFTFSGLFVFVLLCRQVYVIWKRETFKICFPKTKQIPVNHRKIFINSVNIEMKIFSTGTFTESHWFISLQIICIQFCSSPSLLYQMLHFVHKCVPLYARWRNMWHISKYFQKVVQRPKIPIKNNMEGIWYRIPF